MIRTPTADRIIAAARRLLEREGAEAVTMRRVGDKLVYTATNPVQDHLVDRVHHWPGGVP